MAATWSPVDDKCQIRRVVIGTEDVVHVAHLSSLLAFGVAMRVKEPARRFVCITLEEQPPGR